MTRPDTANYRGDWPVSSEKYLLLEEVNTFFVGCSRLGEHAIGIGDTVTLLLMTVLSAIGEVGSTESILELGNSG